MSQFVVCVPQDDFDRVRFQGFRPGPIDDLGGLVAASGWIVPRSLADAPPGHLDHASARSWKQLVTYGVIADPAGRVLTYARAARHGRSDLRGRRSLGVGGHVEPLDLAPRDRRFPARMAAAFAREVAEETGVRPVHVRCLGLLNDDQGSGWFHVGIVFWSELPPRAATDYSAEIHLPAWLDPGSIHAEHLEPWSAALLPLLPRQ